MPYYVGDSLYAIKVASEKPIGGDKGKYTDTNLQAALDGEVCLHWENAKKNGYDYILVRREGNTEIRRKMTAAELKRPVSKWKLADIVKWRRTEKAGDSFESKNRPYSFEEAVVYADAVGVIPCFELKSQLFAKQPARARRMKAIVMSNKAKVYFMTLVTMKRWRGKMKNFHNVGFETALLAHGARKPPDLARWRKYITRVWGRWA